MSLGVRLPKQPSSQEVVVVFQTLWLLRHLSSSDARLCAASLPLSEAAVAADAESLLHSTRE